MLPQPATKGMDRVKSLLRKLFAVGRQIGWISSINDIKKCQSKLLMDMFMYFLNSVAN